MKISLPVYLILIASIIISSNSVNAEFYIWHDENGIKQVSNIPRDCILENKTVRMGCPAVIAPSNKPTKEQADEAKEQAENDARYAKWSREREKAMGIAAMRGEHVIEYVVHDGKSINIDLDLDLDFSFPGESRISDAKKYSDSSIADVTYTNESGGTEQIGEAYLPWYKLLIVPDGFFAYISAQLHDGNRINVDIYLDGEKVKSSNSSGEHSIATASGGL